MEHGVCNLCEGKAGYRRLICQSCEDSFPWQEYVDEVDYATYDVEDNKLRIYSGRVSEALFSLLSTQFQRAYRQGCFFAVWTPYREDIALKLCGEIEEEDSTLEDRALERAERYETYSENAAERSDQRYNRAQKLTERFHMGQPILLDHYSAKRALRDQEKAHNAMRACIAEDKKSSKWASRAEGVLRNAKRKFQWDVVARRIKKLQTERRKAERNSTYSPDDIEWMYWNWVQEQFPETYTLYTQALDLPESSQKSWQEYQEKNKERRLKVYTRWMRHYDGQIEFWSTILEANKPKEAVKREEREYEKGDWVLIKGFRGPVWGQVVRVNRNRTDKTVSSISVDRDGFLGETTYFNRKWIPLQIARILDHKPTDEELEQSVAWFASGKKHYDPVEPNPELAEKKAKLEAIASLPAPTVIDGDYDFFPTPKHIIDAMIREAEVGKGKLCLEPSAGDGRIAEAMTLAGAQVECCEIDERLTPNLCAKWNPVYVGDFLKMDLYDRYDSIVMNPPFSKEQDIAHVRHAWDCLKPGGRLVSIMSEHAFFASNNKCQQFRDWIDEIGYSEKLPDDTFKESGTGVNTRMVVIDKPEYQSKGDK